MNDSSQAQRFDHENFLKHASTRSGVYQMLDAVGETLYVGKALNLKKRLCFPRCLKKLEKISRYNGNCFT
jgi:excinuclease UvrABC nuclease subunit